MDYEKKLALAKEALDSGSYDKETIEYIFPELKESDDEQHRKWILEYLYDGLRKSDEQFKDHFKCAIAWLEKQSKQKPNTDFSNIRIWKYIVDEVLTEKEGIGQYLDSPFTEEVAKKLQKRFGNIEQRPTFEMKTPEESLGIDSDTYNKIVDECVYGEQISANETPYPETLEEAIDLYYNSYGNGEGEFEHLSLEKFRDIVHTFVSDYEQKPAWSEEELDSITAAINNLEYLKNNYVYHQMGLKPAITFLKSLKERVQPKQEWSEDDEKMKDAIYSCVDLHYDGLAKTSLLIWLKSLKPHSTWKPSDEHYELEEFAKIVRGNLTGISKAVQELFEAKYLQLTGNKMYGGYKD